MDQVLTGQDAPAEQPETEAPPASSVDEWRDADVLVALSQAPYVLDLLAAHGVVDVDVDADEGLDLARLRLADPQGAAAAMSASPALAAAGGAPGQAGADRPATQDPLDAVIGGVRAISAARFGGWEPQLGKNRVVGRLGGVNGIVIHGDDDGPATTQTTVAARAPGWGNGATVGILDGPVSEHPWFGGSVQFRYQDGLAGAEHRTAAGHATFVAGLILQEAPSATVRARAALGADGTAEAWDVAKQIVALGNSGIDVLNLSFGCYTADDRPPMVLRQAVSRVDPRVVIVAAAGNYAPNSPLARRPFWPAALGRVIAVGALSRRNGVATRAAFSPAAPWVDVEAVGVDAMSTYLQTARLADGTTADFDGWARWQGTSFAAAVVSGLIARAIVPGRVDAQEACADLTRALRSGAEPRGARLCRWQE